MPETTHSSPGNGLGEAVNGLSMDWNTTSDEVPVFAYLILLRQRWKTIAVGAGICAMVALIITRFVMTPRYRAVAILRPVTTLDGLGKLTGLTTALETGGAAELLGGLSEESSKAQEYESILRSYVFTNSLIDRYKLKSAILAGHRSWLGPAHYTPWKLYRVAQKEFDCEYDDLTGNMTLHFLSTDRVTASRILLLYVDSLREKLRRREVQSAAAAKASLEDEARSTPDSLLQTQLYELIASQLQRQELAQVEADFAFIVIEPPVVPDRPYSPWIILDTLLAGLLAAFLIAFAIIARESWSLSLRPFPVDDASPRAPAFDGHPERRAVPASARDAS